MIQKESRTSKRLLVLVLIATVFGFGALASWAFSSPAGSSPDEDFHLASIWCAQGEQKGFCEGTDNPETRKVPTKLSGSACYAFKAAETGACQGPSYGNDGWTLAETKRGDFLGETYPPGFYFVAHTFVSDNVNTSVLTIRLFNAGLFIALMTVTAIALPARLRLALVGGALVTMVPLGAFLLASANPSSWAIISGATLLVSTIGYLETTGRRRIVLGALAVLSFVIGISSRADAAAYSAVALAAAVVIAWRPSKRGVLWLILPAVLGIGALLAFATAGQGGSALSGSGFNGEHATPLSTLLISNFEQLPMLFVGVFGLGWGLGWLDTAIPPSVWAPACFMFAAAVFGGLRASSWRKSLGGAMIVGALIVIPMYILVKSGLIVGSEVQPRYLLPLITMVATAALLPVASRVLRPSWTQLIVAIALLGMANALALYINLRRYVNGGAGNKLDVMASWAPVGPLGPTALWASGAVCFVISLTAIAFIIRANTHPSSIGERELSQTPDPTISAPSTNEVEQPVVVEMTGGASDIAGSREPEHAASASMTDSTIPGVEAPDQGQDGR